MFDNPFDSFHNAVAEAKEEREQLDRLLTISTPRERILLVVICITVAVFAAWLFLGKVTQSVVIDGMLTIPVETAQAANTSTHSTISAKSVWLTHEEVRRISPGLGAEIEVTSSAGETMTINGKVSEITTARVDEELQPSQTNVMPRLYLVSITLSEEIDATAIRNTNCRILIELDRQSPITLFGMRRA